MQIKEVKVELVDDKSKLVLKRIITDEGEFFNRKLSIPNTIYSCERKRKNYGKSGFGFKFQTHHLRWDSREEEWEFKGLKKARQHAEENNRIFLPYKQRNNKQWENLKWEEAEEDFSEFLIKTKIVPYPIPQTANLEDWKNRKKEALKKLKDGQILMPIFSSKHNVKDFAKLIKYELKSSLILGICCYQLKGVIETSNFSYLKSINSNFKVGDKCSLIACFDYPRILTAHSYVAGSFGYCCFAGDIFSEKAHFPVGMSKEAIEKMLNKKPEEFLFYDPKQKRFNKSVPQKEWYGQDLTINTMKNVSVDEGLEGYQVIKCVSHILQQKDLDLINDILISKKPLIQTIKNYAGWNVFWDTIVNPNMNLTQQSLDY